LSQLKNSQQIFSFREAQNGIYVFIHLTLLMI